MNPRRIAIATLGLLALAQVAGAASTPLTQRVPPGTVVTIAGPAHDVACALGCCCGWVEGVYRGETYGGVYCRWFRPLAEGERVVKTGRADANGYVR